MVDKELSPPGPGSLLREDFFAGQLLRGAHHASASLQGIVFQRCVVTKTSHFSSVTTSRIITTGTEYSCQDQINSAMGCYYARYDFPAGGPGQLQLKCGDRVTVLSRKSEHGGWWKGVVNGKVSGQVGLVAC